MWGKWYWIVHLEIGHQKIWSARSRGLKPTINWFCGCLSPGSFSVLVTGAEVWRRLDLNTTPTVSCSDPVRKRCFFCFFFVGLYLAKLRACSRFETQTNVMHRTPVPPPPLPPPPAPAFSSSWRDLLKSAAFRYTIKKTKKQGAPGAEDERRRWKITSLYTVTQTALRR